MFQTIGNQIHGFVQQVTLYLEVARRVGLAPSLLRCRELLPNSGVATSVSWIGAQTAIPLPHRNTCLVVVE